MAPKLIDKTKKEKTKFSRKSQDCTSFYFILCGERLKKVEARIEQHIKDTGNRLSWPEAVNLLILGK